MPLNFPDTVDPLLLVRVDDDFRIGVALEDMPLLQQLFPELLVIVNLSVKRDPDGPVLVRHGLVAFFRKIDDGKAGVAQGDAVRRVDSRIVRPRFVSFRSSRRLFPRPSS